MAKKEFKAESKRLLDLMINSIYTNQEIFLRELISNASDAIDKLCYLSLTNDKLSVNRDELAIRITVNPEAKTITLSDTGIGMNQEALEENLGVIAKSGSLKFKNDLKEEESTESLDNSDIDIIGQFGVGFYSAFMVSKSVKVISKAYDSDKAYEWESEGEDGYTITEATKTTTGTDIIMTLKDDTDDDNYSKFLSEHMIKNLVKKYSDYVRYPIKMDLNKTRQIPLTDEEKEEGKTPETESYIENETLNDMVPIWHKQKSEVTQEQYNQFYKEKFNDYKDPLVSFRVATEGTISYEALLYVPSAMPQNYFTKDYQKGLQLYSSGVLIMDKASDMIPEYFAFVRGVVDTADLSLNISREILQQDRQLKVIATNVEKKIKRELLKLLKDKREDYEAFFKNFGIQLKYGIANDFGAQKDNLKDLLLFNSSTEEKMTTLAEYVERMKEDQPCIYYACGESITKINQLPQTEAIKDKGYEILYLTDEIDDFVMNILLKYDEKDIKSVNSDDLVDDDAKEKAEEKTKENKDMFEFIKESLDNKVVMVKVSEKLKSHPVCLSSEGGMSLEMEKYFAQMQGNQAMQAAHVLELNPDHKVFNKLQNAFENDKETAKKLSTMLYNQALLIAGFPIEDPTAYTSLLCELLD